MSSLTRKKAWRSSVSQPRVEVAWVSGGVSGRERRREALSGTERPRLHFPPSVLWRRLWGRGGGGSAGVGGKGVGGLDWGVEGRAYVLFDTIRERWGGDCTV